MTLHSVHQYGLTRLSGLLTVAAMLAAFLIANSPLFDLYWQVHHTTVSIQFGELLISRPLIIWINKGLMVFFFLLVGLEIKREMLQGHLSEVKHFILPLTAALGGMVVPALIYTFFNAGDPVVMKGWAIPIATDIVLALAMLSLVRDRIPVALIVFLAALAIFDDIGAIAVIGLYYSEGLAWSSSLIVIAATAGLFILNRLRVVRALPYAIMGLILWLTVLKSGLHPTLVGVIVALFIPLRVTNHGEQHTPLSNMEIWLRPWVMLGITPLFAFFNAGISLPELSLDSLWQPSVAGIVLGLFLGKQIGVFGMTWLMVRLGLGTLPDGVGWRHIYGVALLAGTGFTMSLFVTSLAFDNVGILTNARLAILIGSLLSAVLGFVILRSGKHHTVE